MRGCIWVGVVIVVQAKNVNLQFMNPQQGTESVPPVVESLEGKLVNVSRIWVHCFQLCQWNFFFSIYFVNSEVA